MPTIHLTQAEQQRLIRIIKSDLSDIAEIQQEERWALQDAAFYFGGPGEFRKPAQNRISRNNEKIAKRVSLLKKIKHPEREVI